MTLSYYLVNTITIYRIVAAPLLFVLVFSGKEDLFRWFLPLSFLTDLVDGFLARKFKVQSKKGVLLDSIGDELTVMAGVTGVIVFRTDFFLETLIVSCLPLGLYILETVLSLIRYHRLSGFHTYLSKLSAVLQGVFLVLIFLFATPPYLLFYIAAGISTVALTEEIILVSLLKNWETDVRGLYWQLKKMRRP